MNQTPPPLPDPDLYIEPSHLAEMLAIDAAAEYPQQVVAFTSLLEYRSQPESVTGLYTEHSVRQRDQQWASLLAKQSDAIAELQQWQKLKDADVLHANLMRGLPAQLSKEHLRHLLGD